MQENFTPLINALFCLIPVVFMGLVGLGVVALFFWIISRTTRTKTKAELGADHERIETEVEKLMPQVRPWQPEALAHLHTGRDARWTKFGNNITMHGLIAASKSDAARTWSAFALRGRRKYSGPFSFHGQALARTTEHTFEFDTQAAGVAIQLNDHPFGTLQPDGTLLDSDGQSIGHFQLEGGKRQPTFPVTLRGNVVAHLARPVYNPQGIVLFKRNKQPLPPAVEIVASDITPDDINWLLTLSLWQIINRTVKWQVGSNRVGV